MNKKPRSDSKLDALPDRYLGELRDGLLSGWRLEDAKTWLSEQCAVSTSLASLSAFFKRHCVPILRERRQLAALRAEAIAEDIGMTDWDMASIEKLRQMVFEFMSNPDADIEATERMFKLLLKRKDQELTERGMKLKEEAAAEAKAKLQAITSAAKSKGGLTPETLAEIEAAAGLL